MQRGDRDHEALEPHADVGRDRDREHDRNRPAELLEPEELREEQVATHHRPVRPPVRPCRSVGKRILLILDARVPRDKELRDVGEPDDRSCYQDDDVHLLEVVERDEVLQVVHLARDHHQGHDHREARENGAGDEVGRKDGRVPAGHHRDREVEGDHGVNRQHQRCRKTSEDQVGALIVAPRTVRSGPAQGEEAQDPRTNVRPALTARSRSVAKVRNETDVPEEQRDRPVDRHREHVPEQRALEVRPHGHLVRDRQACSRSPTRVRRGTSERPMHTRPRTESSPPQHG